MNDIHARVKSAQGGTFVPCPIAYKEGVENKIYTTHHDPKYVTCPWCLGYISGRLGAENALNERYDMKPQFMDHNPTLTQNHEP